MSLPEDRSAFIRRLGEIGNDPVEEFTAVLDDLIGWAGRVDWAVTFRENLGKQKVVRYVLRDGGTPFLVAYPQVGEPAKFSVIDTPAGRVTRGIQTWAIDELHTLEVGQPREAKWPMATFEALRQPEKRRGLKDFLHRLLDRLGLAPPPSATAAEPPPRVEATVCRIVRDTDVALWVKQMHQYRCQVCEGRIELPDGRFYAEAHHVRPLGGGHDGPDVRENVVCVCPTHHAELDFGLWDINTSELRRTEGHVIGDEYVRYHNDVIRKRWR